MKDCRKCGQHKKTHQYYKYKSRTDGLDTYCKDCRKEYQKKYILENKEKFINYWRSYNKTRNSQEKYKNKRKIWDKIFLEKNPNYHKNYYLNVTKPKNHKKLCPIT